MFDCSSRCVGAWPGGAARPINPETAAAGDWPMLALARSSSCAARLARRAARGSRRRGRDREEELAGHTAALLVLGLIALLVVATNAFALLFLLPSLHIWLWLPQLRDRPAAARGCGCSQPGCSGRSSSSARSCSARARARCTLVPCGTGRDRLRTDRGLRSGARAGWPGRTADGGRCAADTRRTRPPRSGRRAGRSATRPGAMVLTSRPPPDGEAATSGRRWRCDGTRSADHRHRADRRRDLLDRAGRSLVWQWQDPFTARLREVPAAQAGLELRAPVRRVPAAGPRCRRRPAHRQPSSDEAKIAARGAARTAATLAARANRSDG